MYRFENGMLTITTVIDVSLENEPQSQQEVTFIPVQKSCETQTQTQPKPKKPSKKLRGDPFRFWHTQAQMEFIDHVVLTWLDRARRGDRKIKMPDSILKFKAKEVGKILNKYAKFSANSWLSMFQLKLNRYNALTPQKPVPTTGYPSMLIEEIVREEWSKFFTDSYLMEDSDVEDVQEESPVEILGIGQVEVVEVSRQEADQMYQQQAVVVRESPLQADKQLNETITSKELRNDPLEIVELSDSDDEISNDPIQTYDEALDCLKLVDQFALSARNLEAVALISQIEDLLIKKRGP